MKVQREIENDLIQTFSSQTTKVTNFVKGSIIRAIFTAISGVLAEMWNDLTVSKRDAFVNTSIGDPLDLIGSRHGGVTRLPASPSSAIVVFTSNSPVANGTIAVGIKYKVVGFTSIVYDSVVYNADDTFIGVSGQASWGSEIGGGSICIVVPAGTQLRTSPGGVIYETVEDIALGEKNPNLSGKAQSVALGDSVFAESTSVGIASRAPIATITTIVTPISGVISVTNPAPSTGGDDEESDDIYATRIQDQVSLLNQATQLFYEALAKQADSRVLRAFTWRDASTRGVKILLVRNSGGIFDSGELDAIEAYIADRHRVTDAVTCENVVYTSIQVYALISKTDGFLLADVLRNAADQLANFLDWRMWAWGKTVEASEIIALLEETAGIESVNVPQFKLNNTAGEDVLVAYNSIPRLTLVTIVDQEVPTTAAEITAQAYPNQT